MRLKVAIPKLPVLNIERSLEFYIKLGFAQVVAYPDYAIVERDHVQIHLWRCSNPEIALASGCRVVVEGVVALYAAYSSLNIIHPKGMLETKPWGWREFSVLDTDGNLLTFAERAA
jgi:catechol 2,3-dioxygenase-like lactoylglutathione lyase family enzyme